MTSALDAATCPPLPVRKLHDPCRSLAEVRAEMVARLEDVGSRQAKLVLHRIQEDDDSLGARLAELAREARTLGRWIGVLDDEMGRRS